MQHRSIRCVVVVVSAALAFLNGDQSAAQGTFRVSVDATGVEAKGWSWYPSVSRDGRFVCFSSAADNLVANDTNATIDTFVKDRVSGSIERVSISTHGHEIPTWAWCGRTAISADGRIVAFESTANNLANPANGAMQIFLRDRRTGITSVIAPSSTTAAYGWCWEPSISNDGRFVGFHSDADNLVPNDTNGWPDAFVYDRQTSVITRVSVTSKGHQGNGIFTWPSRVSGDGRYVAFHSDSSNLDPADINATYDIFVHDLWMSTTRMVTFTWDGLPARIGGEEPSLSDDGRWLAFQSRSWDLTRGGPTSYQHYHIYVRDLQTGTNTCVSLNVAGKESNDDSFLPRISGDGRYVAFISEASDLVPGDTNGARDYFLHDRATGITRRVSVALNGDEVHGDPSFWPYGIGLSGDGRFVAFVHDSPDLVPGDSGNYDDIFVHGPYLSLAAELDTVRARAPLTLTTWTGLTGDPVLLYVVDVNGQPTFLPVASGRFDGSGAWAVTVRPPPVLAGSVLTFLGLGLAPTGRLEQTDAQVVTLQ